MSGSGNNNQKDPAQAWLEVSQQFQKSLQELRAQEEKRRQSAAADPRNQHDPESYPGKVAEWALRDRWTVSEAANLLCRCEPSRPLGLPGHDSLDREVGNMREALRRSALDREGTGDDALIDARLVIQWARGKGVALPDALTQHFPAESGESTSKVSTTQVHGNARRYTGQREAVLRAALAVLARYRHHCLDAKGEPTGTGIARVIEAHQATLFESGEAPQSADQMARHIRAALNLWQNSE